MAGLDAFLQKMNCNTIQRKKKRCYIPVPPTKGVQGPPSHQGAAPLTSHYTNPIQLSYTFKAERKAQQHRM